MNSETTLISNQEHAASTASTDEARMFVKKAETKTLTIVPEVAVTEEDDLLDELEWSLYLNLDPECLTNTLGSISDWRTIETVGDR